MYVDVDVKIAVQKAAEDACEIKTVHAEFADL